jgi:NADH-quinone oxidoreductase subunit H
MRFTKINPQTRKSRLTRNAPESRKIKEQRSKGLKIKTTRARAPASHENRLSITAFVIISLVKSVAVVFVLLTAVAYSVWLERKVSAHIQNRWGPTRVGPFGLLQPLADGVKFIFKEDLTEPHVYRPLYIAAPIIALVFAITSISVIPFGNWVDIGPWGTYLQITDLNIGLLVVLGITSMGVYGVALAGWSSNNKYSLLGGLRASAQMISYEVSLGLSLVGVVIMAGSLSLRDIVDAQGGVFWGFIPRWNIFHGQTLAFFIYLISAYAETNRAPFDLPEAESELVAGYHTEYSSMKFAMFFMAEYSNMVTASCVATLLFLGGWHGPIFGPPILQALMPVFWFCLKVFFFMFLYVWVRWTVPRLRYDQLMGFGWKFLLPLAVANIVYTALVVAWRA